MGGTTTIPAGETKRFLTLRNGQDLYVYGTAINTQINSGGIQYVLSGGTASAADILAGGEEIISDGGRDLGATLISGGTLYDSGTASAVTLLSGATLYVSAGGAYSTAVDGGLYVGAGGTAAASEVYSGGFDDISGGAASLTKVTSGGAETVVSGGIAFGTVVQPGGAQFVSAGGTVSQTTVSSAGVIDLISGGSAYGVSILPGGSEINDGGVAAFNVIGNGGQDLLFSGGTDQASEINRGGVEILSAGGISDNASVNAGGAEIVLSGGDAQNTTVARGGSLVLLPGAQASGTQSATADNIVTTGVVLVNPGSGVGIYAATANQLIVSAGGDAYVLNGGTANAVELAGDASAFAALQVISGGQVSGVTINSGGAEYISRDAVESAGLVYSAGYIYVAGESDDDVLSAGGTMLIQSGGQALNTIISAGARQFVGSGAIALFTTVANGADQLISGGIAFGTEVASGGSIYVDANSTAIATLVQGEEILSSGAIGEGASLVGGTLVLSAGSDFLAGVSFSGSGGVLDLDTTSAPVTPINGFSAGDAIDLNTLTYDPANEPAVTAPGTLVVGGISLNITDAMAASQFELVAQGAGTAILTDYVSCFAAGTRILTPAGEVPVEALGVGDEVITAEGEDAPIIWIGRRSLILAVHPRPESVQPIRFAAESLGPLRPARDLLLSPDHAVLCGGLLVPARLLVNGANITQLTRARVTYYHIELAEHSIVFAENVPVETYLDTGGRGAFEKVGVVQRRVYEEARAARDALSCRPVVEEGAVVAGARLAAARRSLALEK